MLNLFDKIKPLILSTGFFFEYFEVRNLAKITKTLQKLQDKMRKIDEN